MYRAHPEKIKDKAKKMRLSGMSYGRISKTIGIPKSTLSTWLKDTPLPETYRRRYYTKQIEMITKGEFSQKTRRIKEINTIKREAAKTVGLKISNETLRFMGVSLYWAEGTKDRLFEITNSDPKLILFMVEWIEKIFKIPSYRLTARLNIHANQDNTKIINFWSKLCNIPVKNFRKSFVKPPGKHYKKNKLYYGTIKITIPRSTNLKYELLSWLDVVLKNIDKKVKSVSEHYKVHNTRP